MHTKPRLEAKPNHYFIIICPDAGFEPMTLAQKSGQSITLTTVSMVCSCLTISIFIIHD